MEELIAFYAQYGWQLALIALLGLIILGILKYAKVFSKIEKEKCKPIYLAISVGFSLLASIIYLLVIGQFEFGYLVGVSTSVYALNQAMYTVYENTTLRDLVQQVLALIFEKRKDEVE